MEEWREKTYGHNTRAIFEKTLDEIIIYFMKTILHLQESGIEKLPLEYKFQEPIKSYIKLSVDLIMEGELETVTDLIMRTEYDHILKKYDCDTQVMLCLNVIRTLSSHIHYDTDYYHYILSLENIWGNNVFEYASKTFYINIPDEYRDKYKINELIKHIPFEMMQPHNY